MAFPNTTFISKVTTIATNWLQAVNDFINGFPDPATGPSLFVQSNGTSYVLAAAGGGGGRASLGTVYDVTQAPFNAPTDGTTPASAAIQAAINYANANGGGLVWLPAYVYNLGSIGLVSYSNVTVAGPVNAYVSINNRGAVLKYTGTGLAFTAAQVTNTHLKNVSIDATGSSGASRAGIDIVDAWLSSIEDVRVSGIPPAGGYGIRWRNSNPGFYTQHNTMTRVECSDGMIRVSAAVPLNPTPGADVVTTMVFDTIRGMQYEVDNSQVVFINCTAEQWPSGFGYNIFGPAAVATLIGCDIEQTNAALTGITMSGGAKVREYGTVWNGFAGGIAKRVNGVTQPITSYGGEFQQFAALAAGTPQTALTVSDANTLYGKMQLVPTNVSGGSQEGYWRQTRLLLGLTGASSEIVSHDPRFGPFVLQNVVSGINAATYADIIKIQLAVSAGCSIKITAIGIQPGNVTLTETITLVANNSAGVIVTSIDTPVGPDKVSQTVPTNKYTAGHPAANTFSVSFLLGSASPPGSTATWAFIYEIVGNIAGYTLT